MSAALPDRGQTRRLGISGTRGVVGRCRDFSRTALADWGWLPDSGSGSSRESEPSSYGTHGDTDASYGGLDRDSAPDLDVDFGHDLGRDFGQDFDMDLDEDFDWDDERRAVAEDVLMVVSELVTNACLHAGGPTQLVLHCTAERLRIEVTDASPVPPRPRPRADPALPGGHGLVVLGRLARAWGSVPSGSGKAVWAEIAAPRRR
ncbi:ATP-binding protein [Streptomyces sp. NPDC000410]|uniref:ATP-binding protein n=1 Tax=Streptomyces sp. NPDC000410 TaxID=3154254 RepID=UPI0033346473